MKITKLKIDSFGTVTDREITLEDGVNLIGGANESGKTSLAMFIKFILYGLGGRASEQFPTGEKKRFINWTTGRAAGSMEFVSDGKAYRVERSCALTGNGDATRESVRVIAADSGEILRLSGEVGEMFLGVPESVFVNTVFVRQIGGAGVDTAAISTAIENMLSSADESIGVDKAIKKLEKLRVELMHKNSTGGEIRALERSLAEEEAALSEAESESGAVIAAQGGLEKALAEIDEANANAAHAKLIGQLYEDIRNLSEREQLCSLTKDFASAREEAERTKNALPDKGEREKIARARAELAIAAEQVERCTDALNALALPEDIGFTAEDCDDALSRAEAYSAALSSKKLPTVLLCILGIISLAAGAVFFTLVLLGSGTPKIVPILLGVLAVTLFAASVAVAFSTSADKKVLRTMCGEWGAENIDALSGVISASKAKAQSVERDALKRAEAGDSLRTAEEMLDGRKSEAAAICDIFGVEYGDDPERGLDLCEQLIANAEEAYSTARETAAELSVKCRAASEALSECDFNAIKLRQNEHEFTPAWDEAESLDKAGYEKVVRTVRFNEQKVGALKDRAADFREILAAHHGRTASQIGESIENLRTELEEKKLRYDAIQLAIDTLAGAGENLRRGMIPRMVAEASATFERASAGKYPSLGIGSTFSMTYESGDGTRSTDYLSAGSADGAYISLRLALATALFTKDMPPMIFDESFAMIDEERADALLGILSERSGQSLVFTCRESELHRAAGQLGGFANVIEL